MMCDFLNNLLTQIDYRALRLYMMEHEDFCSTPYRIGKLDSYQINIFNGKTHITQIDLPTVPEDRYYGRYMRESLEKLSKVKGISESEMLARIINTLVEIIYKMLEKRERQQ